MLLCRDFRSYKISPNPEDDFEKEKKLTTTTTPPVS